MSVDTASALPAVSLEEVKAHLRLDTSADDDLIKTLMLAVTQRAEHELQRGLITRQGTDGFGEDPSDVPAAIRQWILIHVAHLYEQWQAATAGELKPSPFVNFLLDPFRTWL